MKCSLRSPPLNAKAETVHMLPMFRDAYARRRCLMPIDLFFEWKASKGEGQAASRSDLPLSRHGRTSRDDDEVYGLRGEAVWRARSGTPFRFWAWSWKS